MIYSPRLSPPHIFQRTWTRFSSFVANGLMTAVRRYEEDANDVVTSIAESLYTYNANNAVTSITHKNPNGTQIVQHSYTYDSTNNIVEYLNSIDGQTSYDYDFLGQLIGADYANGSISDETYTYDENGNRVTANGNTYTTGTNNELTSDGDFTYTYDAEGNRISKTNVANTERELYTWDYRNRLTTVTKQTYDTLTNEWTTVQIVEYAYDYNNIWIRKVIGNSKTIFIPENYQTTIQIDNGTTTHHYLWTPNQQDKLLADTTTSGILWALTDHLGTIRDVLDGNSSTHLIYDAFGNLISGTNPILFGYTGKAFDSATNLQNNINRWYDATIGRWLSTDPIGFEGNGINLYQYVENKSTFYVDYLGMELVAPWHPEASWRPSDTFNAWKGVISEAWGQVQDIAKQTAERINNVIVAAKNNIEEFLQSQLDILLVDALNAFQDNPSVSFDRQLRWEKKISQDTKLIGAFTVGAKYNIDECSVSFRFKPAGTLQIAIPVKSFYTLGSSPCIRMTFTGNLSKKYYLKTKKWDHMKGIISVSPAGAVQWKFQWIQGLVGEHAAEVGMTGKLQIYPTIKPQGCSVYGRFYWQSPGWFNGTHRREWKINWGLWGSGAEAEIL